MHNLQHQNTMSKLLLHT